MPGSHGDRLVARQGLTLLDRDSGQPSLMQHACRYCDAAAARAEHHRRKFVGNGHVIGFYAVMAHQKPPGQALFELVYAIAGGGLIGLREQGLSTALQQQERQRNTFLLR